MQPQLNIGSLLGQSLKIYGANLASFLLISLIAYSPVIVGAMLLVKGTPTEQESALYAALIAVGAMVFGTMATGAMSYGVIQQLRGKPAGVGECVSVGLRRLAAVLGVALLSGLCILGGTLLLIIPGIVLACSLCLATPAAVVEGTGPVESLRRSRFLTDGSRMSLFGTYVVIGVVQGVFGAILEASLVVTGNAGTQIFVSLAEMIVFGAWQSTAIAVAYHDLRVMKEGVDVEQLAAVFE